MTQFLFEGYFGLKFINDLEQRTEVRSTQVYLSEEDNLRILETNNLDLKLYEFAKDLFYRRVHALERTLNKSVDDYFDKAQCEEKWKNKKKNHWGVVC